MKNREITTIILFWILYMPACLVIWSLTDENLIDFILVAGIGVGIIIDYLLVECFIYFHKKRKREVINEKNKEEINNLVGFRRLFSEEPLEVEKWKPQ